jgi:L-phenylalanine/L-methionine N-acetyltransferase
MHFEIATPRPNLRLNPAACGVSLCQREVSHRDALMEMFQQPLCRQASVLDPFASSAFDLWLSDVNPRNFEAVATLGGRAIGLSGLFPLLDAECKCASLVLFVHDAFQGRGIGTMLMAALVSTAYLLDLERLELSVFCDNARAISLYKKFGFRIDARKGCGTRATYAMSRTARKTPPNERPDASKA